MRLGLISDLHGDFAATELVWARLTAEEGVDAVLCAGDLVGYGPQPERVVNFVLERGLACAQGNHDAWAAGREPGSADPFGYGDLSREAREALGGLPDYRLFEADGRVILLTHSLPGDFLSFLNPETMSARALEEVLEGFGADVYVHGHTHRPVWHRSGGGGLVVNPGSLISGPGARSTSRTYAVLETGDLSLRFHDVETGAVREVKRWAGG